MNDRFHYDALVDDALRSVVRRVLTQVADTLGEGANQIVAASGQLAAASQSLAHGANEQAASLEETSSAPATRS